MRKLTLEDCEAEALGIAKQLLTTFKKELQP